MLGHKQRSILFYALILLVFGCGIYAILALGSAQTSHVTALDSGQSEQATRILSTAPVSNALSALLVPMLHEGLRNPLSILLLQLVVIVTAAKGMGFLFRCIGQPAVIGEMLAGICLGPSLLGAYLPAVQGYLFPPDSLNILSLLSQLGVILFMFVVGLELDLNHLRKKSHAAVVVSHASIIIPFFIGTVAALLIYPVAAAATTPFSAFALFMGIAMSITAFPVLARIIQERGWSHTPLGTTIIACAAVDDVTAWCLLAVVVAIAQATVLAGVFLTIALAILFGAGMVFVIRPWLQRLVHASGHDGTLRTRSMVLVLIFVFISALFTEVIGIHALFGAFLAGVIMPADLGIRTYIRERVETFALVVLLPLFFVSTGLRTQIGLLNDWQGWLLCAVIIALAVVGKLGGSMFAARWTGMDWHDSFVVGACMNTRGLVELVVLNIGYDMGILSPRIFTVMVLMALTTTCMTGPLLSLAEYWRRRYTLPAMGTGVAA